VIFLVFLLFLFVLLSAILGRTTLDLTGLQGALIGNGAAKIPPTKSQSIGNKKWTPAGDNFKPYGSILEQEKLYGK
jgi:hypothetical protein